MKEPSDIFLNKGALARLDNNPKALCQTCYYWKEHKLMNECEHPDTFIYDPNPHYRCPAWELHPYAYLKQNKENNMKKENN